MFAPIRTPLVLVPHLDRLRVARPRHSPHHGVPECPQYPSTPDHDQDRQKHIDRIRVPVRVCPVVFRWFMLLSIGLSR